MVTPDHEPFETFDDAPAPAPVRTPPPAAGPDVHALAQAAERLRTAYDRLSPALRDPEKRTLRFWRTQQRLQWVVMNYGNLLPEELLTRFHGRVGRTYLTGPFDESVPSRRAVVTLRALTREVLAGVAAAVDRLNRKADHW